MSEKQRPTARTGGGLRHLQDAWRLKAPDPAGCLRGRCFRASVHAVVAVTDKRWSDFFSVWSHLTEANFWTPPSVGFRALTTDEPMLFMPRALPTPQPLVGCGFVSGLVTLRVGVGWRFFREGSVGRASARSCRTFIATARVRGRPLSVTRPRCPSGQATTPARSPDLHVDTVFKSC